MSKPFSYENSLRIHEQALYEWLGQVTVDYGTIAGKRLNRSPIIRVFASPRRAFATVMQTLVRQGVVPEPPATFDDAAIRNVMPFPVVSINRQDMNLSTERHASPLADYRNLEYRDGEWKKHFFPQTWDITYQIEIWAKHQYTIAYLQEWFASQLGKRGAGPNELFVEVEHPHPWGKRKTALRIDSATDNSDLEAGTDQEKILRFSISATLRALFCKNVEDSSPILNIQRDTSHEEDANEDPIFQRAETSANLIPRGNLNKYLMAENGANIVALEEGVKLGFDGTADARVTTGKLLTPGTGLYFISGKVRRSPVNNVPLNIAIVNDGDHVDVFSTALTTNEESFKHFFRLNASNDALEVVMRQERVAWVNLRNLVVKNAQPYIGANQYTLPGAWTVFSLPAGDSTQQSVEVNNADKPHILCANVLTSGVNTSIIIVDDLDDPTYQKEIQVVGGAKSICEVVQPKFEGTHVGLIIRNNDSAPIEVTVEDILVAELPHRFIVQ